MFPELFAVLMLALSNAATSNDAGFEQAGSPQAPLRLESPGLQDTRGSFDLPDLDQGSFQWDPAGRPAGLNQHNLRNQGFTYSSRNASRISGVPLFYGGFFFVRMTDYSDPSHPLELLCLMDENGNIILSIVLSLQTGYGENTLGTSDGDLSAPVVYTTP